MNVIEIRDLKRHYHLGGETIRALDGVSFDIAGGEYVAIVGPSGSGKSTLMNLLGCLDSPTDGSYVLDGRRVSDLAGDELASVRNRRIGFVFQSFHLLSRLSAKDNVALPLLYSGLDDRSMAQRVLQDVGLGERGEHWPNQLSGGQCQRVAIARALVCRPAILLADEPTGNLDSRTGAEIMQLFDELHRQGMTVILVTHDLGVAERAHRIIQVKDGKILEDSRTARSLSEADRAANALPETGFPLYSGALRETKPEEYVGPRWHDLLRIALNSLTTAKLRTALSVLGVVIGVAAVTTMLALGNGARASVATSIGSLGTNLLTIRPGQGKERHVRSSAVQTLTPEDAKAIAAECPLISEIAPEVNGSAQAKYFDKNTLAQITGTTPEFETVRNQPVAYGRFLSEEDVRSGRKVVVLGATPAEQLFGQLPAVGERIKIKGQSFQVIGVLEAKGQGSGFRNPDEMVLVPLSTAMKKLFGQRHLSAISVSVGTREKMAEASEQIDRTLRARHRTREGEDPDFNVGSQEDLLDAMTQVTQTFTLLLSGIAAVSLLVGGIGIMNIMLVSVTERTKEIGVRKAIGARGHDIMRQFLAESMVISLMGGAVGLGLGIGLSELASYLTGWTMIVPGYAHVLAFGFSAGVGTFFGAYPAARASRLDPIEALRTA